VFDVAPPSHVLDISGYRVVQVSAGGAHSAAVVQKIDGDGGDDKQEVRAPSPSQLSSA